MSNLTINLLSDSLGNTAQQVAMAAMAQFGLEKMGYKKISYVTDKDILRDALSQIENQENPIILYTVVNKDLIHMIENFSEKNSISAVDLLTPSIDAIREAINVEPKEETGMLRKLNSLYFKRVECIEFAVKYDDGKDPRGILLADLVIIGISRTSKTPLSMYLANNNVKVCNIPLVPEAVPPSELFEIDPVKIVGLTNTPEKLIHIRTERLAALGLPGGSSYADTGRIIEEIEYADTLMRRIGCLVIDVSNKAIEETAEIIISYLKRNDVKIHN